MLYNSSTINFQGLEKYLLTLSNPWCSRTRAGDAHIAPYGLLDSLCFFSMSTNFSELANAWAPPRPPCVFVDYSKTRTSRSFIAFQKSALTGRTIRSYDCLAASSRSTSATSLTFLEATISNVSSKDATTT